MSIRRITISVPARVATRIKKAAAGSPVSTWVTNVIEQRLDDTELERLWEEFYRDVAPTPRDIARGDAIFARVTSPKPKKARRTRAA